MGFDPRLEEPHRRGDRWKVWKWLHRNVAADHVTAFATIIQAIILGIGLISLYYAKKTLDEGNRIAWRTYLDNKSAEMGRLLFQNDVFHCIYEYDVIHIDVHCPSLVYDRKNLPLVIEYTNQMMLHLAEIKMYSDREDSGYYEEWSAPTARDLADDPTGIVSFVLWKYAACEQPEPSTRVNPVQLKLTPQRDGVSQDRVIDPTMTSNCDFARSIGICITNEQFQQDPDQCFTNLAKKRDKFLRGIGERGVGEQPDSH